MKQELRLGSKKIFHDALKQTHELEVVNRDVGIWEDPVPSQKKEELSKAQLSEKKSGDGGANEQTHNSLGSRSRRAALMRDMHYSWRVITLRNEPRGRKGRPITDVPNTDLGKEEMALCL
jgi:hypothetical protein